MFAHSRVYRNLLLGQLTSLHKLGLVLRGWVPDRCAAGGRESRSKEIDAGRPKPSINRRASTERRKSMSRWHEMKVSKTSLAKKHQDAEDYAGVVSYGCVKCSSERSHSFNIVTA